MTNKHLKTGDPQPPPVEPGKLRVYSMKLCPYAMRARLALAAKGVTFEVVNINLQNKPEWITSLHPQGKVPALEVGGEKIVVESLDIADYLDGKLPEPRLWPADANTKARHKKLIDEFGKITSTLHRVTMAKDKQEAQKHLDEIAIALQPYEDELAKVGSTFFGGSRPGMLDYMIWPWADSSEVPCIIHKQLEFPMGRFPKLVAWREAMKNDPAVKAEGNSTEVYLKFRRSYMEGKPDYDNL